MAGTSSQPLSADEVLRKFNGRIFSALHSPQTLAEFAYAEQLISDDTIDDLASLTTSQAKSKLLSAIRATVKTSDRKEVAVTNFILCLEQTGEPALKELASEMRVSLSPDSGDGDSVPSKILIPGHVQSCSAQVSSSDQPHLQGVQVNQQEGQKSDEVPPLTKHLKEQSEHVDQQEDQKSHERTPPPKRRKEQCNPPKIKRTRARKAQNRTWTSATSRKPGRSFHASPVPVPQTVSVPPTQFLPISRYDYPQATHVGQESPLSRAQTSYDPQLAQMQTNPDQCLAQTQTWSSPQFAPSQAGSGPAVADIQSNYTPKSTLAVPTSSVVTKEEESTDGEPEYYSMKSSPHGYCVIINNVEFVNMESRRGSDQDADRLHDLFGSYLDFFTGQHDNLTSKGILACLQSVQKLDHSRFDCLVVAILSHGGNGEVYGSDDVPVSVMKLKELFRGTSCPLLIGKPKIFIIQACRGRKIDYGVTEEKATDSAKEAVIEDEIFNQDEVDGGGYNITLPDMADFVTAYATPPGYVARRNSACGSWFIEAFTKTMYKMAATDHFMDILTVVNRKVAEEYESREKEKQMPTSENGLRCKLYIRPRSGASRTRIPGSRVVVEGAASTVHSAAQDGARATETDPSSHCSNWSLDGLPDGNLDDSHLADLVDCLYNLRDWMNLGVFLGIPYPTLDKIELDKRGVDNRKIAMFHHWLSSGSANKEILVRALTKMGNRSW